MMAKVFESARKPMVWLSIGALFYFGLAVLVPPGFIGSSRSNFSLTKFYAELLVEEHSWSAPYHIAPGQPALVALASSAFPITDYTVRFMQLILILLLSVGTYLLADLLFDRRVAKIAGAFILLWPPVGLHLFSQSTDMLFSVLVVFAIFFFVKAQKVKRSRYAVAAGMSAALAVLTDPVGLYMPLILAFTFIIRAILTRNERDLLRRVSLIGVFLAVFAASVLPWYYRNLAVFGDAAPVVQKGWEIVIIEDATLRSYIFDASKPAHFPEISRGLGQFFLVPYGLDSLDRNTELSYKSLARDLLNGELGLDAVPNREKMIFTIKAVITLAHWTLLAFAVIGLWQARRSALPYLYIFLVLYLIFGTFSYGIPENFRNISPLNGFYFGLLPLTAIISIHGILSLIENKNQKSHF